MVVEFFKYGPLIVAMSHVVFGGYLQGVPYRWFTQGREWIRGGRLKGPRLKANKLCGTFGHSSG